MLSRRFERFSTRSTARPAEVLHAHTLGAGDSSGTLRRLAFVPAPFDSSWSTSPSPISTSSARTPKAPGACRRPAPGRPSRSRSTPTGERICRAGRRVLRDGIPPWRDHGQRSRLRRDRAHRRSRCSRRHASWMTRTSRRSSVPPSPPDRLTYGTRSRTAWATGRRVAIAIALHDESGTNRLTPCSDRAQQIRSRWRKPSLRRTDAQMTVLETAAILSRPTSRIGAYGQIIGDRELAL